MSKVDATGALLEPDYAHVVIDGVDYFPLLYRIDGVLYTQNIKLDVLPNRYTVTWFEATELGNFDPARTSYTWNILIRTACRWCGLAS